MTDRNGTRARSFSGEVNTGSREENATGHKDRASIRHDGIGERSRILVDLSHTGRHMTGLERIALELFSDQALAPLPIETVTAQGARGMMRKQMLDLPAMAVRDRRALFLCPGFPPMPHLVLAGGDRVIPYIHDLFLMTRWNDLNPRAKLYMALPFRFALRRLKHFFCNSRTTAETLRPHVRDDAEIRLYRPAVRNVFSLSPVPAGGTPKGRLIALGTIEPRKNLFAATAILRELRQGPMPDATLDLVGRPGWGVDVAALAAEPGVTVHGYQPMDRVKTLIEGADMLLSTSHDEGLGLPLLEAQYAGLAVAAPDQPVFREVLGASGLFIDPARAAASAYRITAALAETDMRSRRASVALANIQRWNATAERDRTEILAFLDRLSAPAPSGVPAMAGRG
jgi:glycosyltransferase involved in cell wall biosynthesis